MREEKVPGIAVVYYDGHQGTILTFGLADRERQVLVGVDTLFELASITKVFTATDLALQVQRGRMSLDDPLSKYLPALKNTQAGLVTLEQLATHTSSLPRDPKSNNKRSLVMRYVENWTPTYPIGTRYVYSNMAFGLLGWALESLDKMTYEQILKQDILKPLGMNSSMLTMPTELKNQVSRGYSPQNELVPQFMFGSLQAGGALRSTASDMLKFLEANLGVLGPEDILKAMQLAQEGRFKVSQDLTLGLGWQRYTGHQFLIIDKNGGLNGFSSYIGMVPEKTIGIVILANKAKVNTTRIGRALLTRFAKTYP